MATPGDPPSASSSSPPPPPPPPPSSPPPPSVSVLMCAYNAAPFLRESVDSILHQSMRDFELIIVDDGSTDETSDILRQYAEQDPRIRLHLQSRNVGVAASLQSGLALVRAPLVARMDADDVALPRRLELQRAFMDAHADVDVLGTAVEIFRSPETPQDHSDSTANLATAAAAAAAASSSAGAGASTPAAPVPAAGPCSSSLSAGPLPPSRVISLPLSPALVSWSLPFFCPLASPTVMYRAARVRGAGGYALGWLAAEDLELWQRMDRAGARMANLPQVLLRLRKHHANVSAPAPAAQPASCDAPAAVDDDGSGVGGSSATAGPRPSPPSPPALRSSPLQQLHALMATQVHVSHVVRGAVSLELVAGLARPSEATLPTLAYVHSAFSLLQALERAALRLPPEEATAASAGAARPAMLSPVDRASVQRDCTARMGELVALAMRMDGAVTQADSAAVATPSDAAAEPPLASLRRAAAAAAASRLPNSDHAPCFSLPTIGASSSSRSLLATWMGRGADAAGLLSKLMLSGSK